MQTIKSLLCCAVVLLTIALSSVEAQADKNIGVLLSSSEVRYQEALKGLKERLEERGFGGKHVTLIVENADGNKAKVEEVVKQFGAAELDLIVVMGTNATIGVSREIHDVPIVFVTVYDPIEAGIAKTWNSSGNNTTGITTKIPMSLLMDSLKTFKEVNRLTVLYTPGEKNSELQLTDLQRIHKDFALTVEPVSLAKWEEVNHLLPEVFRNAEAVYITGSNFVNSQLPMIVDYAIKAKVVTISHLDDLITKGVLLGMCTNNYAGGRLAAEKVIQILKGAKPSSLPIEPPKKYDVLLNMKTARLCQFEIPPCFMKTVTRIIE